AHHFADVVRGLPTLRAFNRADAQVEQIELVSDRYRAATMGTLRVAFLSGSVLELAATIAVALVAVTVGVRLVEGALGFRAGLPVLILPPALSLPTRTPAAQSHASADGAAVAGRLLDLIEAPSPVPAARRGDAPDLQIATIQLERVSFRYPGRMRPALEDVDLELAAGEAVALVRASGGGEGTKAPPLLPPRQPARGPGPR